MLKALSGICFPEQKQEINSSQRSSCGDEEFPVRQLQFKGVLRKRLPWTEKEARILLRMWEV